MNYIPGWNSIFHDNNAKIQGVGEQMKNVKYIREPALLQI